MANVCGKPVCIFIPTSLHKQLTLTCTSLPTEHCSGHLLRYLSRLRVGALIMWFVNALFVIVVVAQLTLDTCLDLSLCAHKLFFTLIDKTSKQFAAQTAEC